MNIVRSQEFVVRSKRQGQTRRESAAVIIVVLMLLFFMMLAEKARAGENQSGVGSSEFGTKNTMQDLAHETARKFEVTMPDTGFHGDDMAIQNLMTVFAVQRMDSAQKISYLGVLAAVDYLQTVNTVVRQPERYREMNPILGEHPTRRSLALFGAAGIATVRALDKYLPEMLAHIVVDSIIMTEQVNVWENQYTINKRTRMPVMIAASYRF